MSTSNDTTIPYGYCQCGCGQKTKLAPQTHQKLGWIKGEPIKYIVGHCVYPYRPLEERFWSKVAITANPDKCWEWQPSTGDDYGRISVDGKNYKAHRVAYELTYGAIPDGLLVCHKCDNPKCCNPSHLFLGTKLDNNRDRDKKGRYHKMLGEKNGRHKFTDEQVRYVRKRHSEDGISCSELAREIGAHRKTIWAIVKGLSRKTC